MKGSMKKSIARAVSQSAAVFARSMLPLETKAVSLSIDIVTGSKKWPGGREDRIKSPFVAGKSDSRRPSQWAGG